MNEAEDFEEDLPFVSFVFSLFSRFVSVCMKRRQNKNLQGEMGTSSFYVRKMLVHR